MINPQKMPRLAFREALLAVAFTLAAWPASAELNLNLSGGNFQPIALSACGVQLCGSFGGAGFAVPNGSGPKQ